MTITAPDRVHSQTAPTDATPRRNILGVDVLVLDRDGAVERVRQALDGERANPIAFLNAHGANLARSDADYREALAGFDVLADGIGVDIASRALYGEPFPANLNGTDFIRHLLVSLDGPMTVGLFGARAGVAEAAAEALKDFAPHHFYRTLGDGYSADPTQSDVLARLEAHPVDILLVAMGNPAQEQWIAQHIDERHARVPIGIGALFDFLAGRVPRAPQWLIDARLEWVFRLGLEPARMWKRYLLGNPVFLARVLRQKVLGPRP